MNDITYLVGRVFCDRRFRSLSADDAVKAAPSGDLTPEQEKAFRAAWDNPALREAVEDVWMVYDQEREAGSIPAASPWYD